MSGSARNAVRRIRRSAGLRRSKPEPGDHLVSEFEEGARTPESPASTAGSSVVRFAMLMLRLDGERVISVRVFRSKVSVSFNEPSSSSMISRIDRGRLRGSLSSIRITSACSDAGICVFGTNGGTGSSIARRRSNVGSRVDNPKATHTRAHPNHKRHPQHSAARLAIARDSQ